MKSPDIRSVATRLPPAVGVPTTMSRFCTSNGIKMPREAFPSFCEVAAEHSNSKAAALRAATSPGFASAWMARTMLKRRVSFGVMPMSAVGTGLDARARRASAWNCSTVWPA
ncbi:hypothetical protein D3C71_1798490 [compost metagenome]